MIKTNEIVYIAQKAGQKILEIYLANESAQQINTKADNSPLTLADLQANKIICDDLQQLYPTIPIVSEELELPSFEIRKKWKKYWLVDPLDGTKEFVKRNGQFTVNIALVEDGIPVLGVIQVPVSGDVYFSDKNGAYVLKNGLKTKLNVNKKCFNLISIGSNSHATENEKKIYKQISNNKPYFNG